MVSIAPSPGYTFFGLNVEFIRYRYVEKVEERMENMELLFKKVCPFSSDLIPRALNRFLV